MKYLNSMISPPSALFSEPKRTRQVAGSRQSMIWRVQNVARLLQATPYLNCTQIAAHIEGVSIKSIRRDLKFMREQLEWPVEYNPKRGGYHFTRPIGELPSLKLTRGELVSLFIAKHALEPLRGTKLARILEASVEKIAEACPEHVSFHWQDLDEAFSVKASGVSPANVEIFNNLLDAAMHGKEVTFSYLKLAGSEREPRRLRPYHVGQVDHAWYVIGFDLDRQAVRNFAITRLSDLRATKVRFKKPEDFNARRYLNGGFGVWGYGDDEAKQHAVEIEFTDWAARVVAERQWHTTQEIEDVTTAPARVIFRATVSGLEEITRWVLSWGSKARVIGPQELLAKVRLELRSALDQCDRA